MGSLAGPTQPPLGSWRGHCAETVGLLIQSLLKGSCYDHVGCVFLVSDVADLYLSSVRNFFFFKPNLECRLKFESTIPQDFVIFAVLSICSLVSKAPLAGPFGYWGILEGASVPSHPAPLQRLASYPRGALTSGNKRLILSVFKSVLLFRL